MSKTEGEEPKVFESDKMLAQINAMKKGTPPTESVKEPVNSKPEEPKPTLDDKASKPSLEQQPAPQDGKAAETTALDDKKSGKPEVDIREWAKRKGFKEGDQESVLKAYREMERKLSKVNAERSKSEGNVPRGTEPPAYQPTPNWAPQYPPFQPQMPPQGWQPSPPQYVDRRAIIEQEAQRFNVTPEDLERMLPIINEVTELKLNRTQAALQARYDNQLAELNRGSKRNAEFNELLTDPNFTNPEVAFEINKIFEENPQRLKLEPTPWTNAYRDAMFNIARRNLSGTPQAEENGALPLTPPKSGGQGSTPRALPANSPGTVIDKFKRLSAEEMEKQLVELGAIKSSGGVSFE